MSIVATSPNLLGMGIDEDTAAEVRDGRVFTVLGTGAVFVVDARGAVTDAPDARRGAPLLVSGAVVHSLPTGATLRPAHGDADATSSSGTPTSMVARPRAKAETDTAREATAGHFAPHRGDRTWSARTPRAPPGPPRRTSPILETRVYRGPNIWSYEPAIHLVVDLGMPRGLPHRHPRRLHRPAASSCCPAWSATPARAGSPGGFVERLHEGTWLGHVAEHVALQLQQEAGHDLRRGKTRAGQGPPRPSTTSSTATPTSAVGLAAGQLAVRLVNHLVQAGGRASTSPRSSTLFLRRAERMAFGPSTAAILEEAVSRDIPYIRLNEHSLVQLGQGVHAQRIRATMTSKTGALAVDIAGDKDLTTKLLASAGLPGAQAGDRCARRTARSRRPTRIGYPVVVKPLDGNHGRGVCLDLPADGRRPRRPSTSPRASPGAATSSSSRFVTGRDYRCLIVGGRMQAIAERVPAHVVGDGTHTVAELVDITNADPRRGVGHEKVLTRIKVDDAAIELVRDAGLRAGRRAARGRDGQARAHRQHVDRRHLGRPHLRRPPRQRRDRRGGRPDDRARRRRHRLHLPRHRLARPRDRRRDLRGQRRPRLPDAHAPDRRRAAVHRQAGRRPALPAGRARRGCRSSPSPAPTARPRRRG